MKLTDAAIRRNARVEKPTKLADGHGLYLQINPTGSKLWKLKYRINGVERKLSLGAYPEIGLREAREKAIEARKLVGESIDPSQAKRAAKAERLEANDRTFGKVAGQWFTKWQTGKAEATIKRERLHMGYAVARVGSMPVTDIRSRDVARCVEDIERISSSGVASRCLGLIVEVMGYALARGEVEANVALGLRKVLTPIKQGHRAAVVEESALGDVLRKVWSYGGLGVSAAAMKALPYLFVRPGELCAMRWAEVDLDRGEWRYATSKTGTEMVVPLARQVVEIIKEMKGRDDNLVFPVARQTLALGMRLLGVSGEQSSHGWRATARTILDEGLGFRPDWIEMQLGHRVRDVNGRAYNRTSHLEGRRQMMQAWADYLDGLRLGEEVERDNVVSLRR